MENVIAWVIISVLLVALYLTLFFNIKDCLDTVIFARERKKMFRALEGILSSHYCSDDTSICFEEMILIFKHIIDKNNDLKRSYSSIDILLERYLIALNSNDTKIVNMNVSDVDGLKKYIFRLIKEYKQRYPMEQIKGANNVLLNQLIECEKNSDSDKFTETINQLAVEIKTLQDNLFEKEKDSKKQNAVAIIGIVLSVIFGIMTFVQFFV